MARKRVKKKTHAGGRNGPSSKTNNASRDPKSMVIRVGAGDVGPSVTQLVKDVRSVMEPETAGRLKERRSNRLRDYTAMAGPLGVTHLLLFSRSTSGNTNMRLALTPRGPTLHFRVERYSLAKDVKNSQKRPQMSGKEHHTPPLLVMNNFLNPAPTEDSQPAVPKHLESLTTTVFQSLFPAISPQKTPLCSINRVLLLNRELLSKDSKPDDAPFVLNFRHYAISTKQTGLSRSIRRLNAAEKLIKQTGNRKNGVPNLGRLEDVSDFLLDPSATATGFTSGSESEADSDAAIEVLEAKRRKVLSRKQLNAKRASGAKASEAGAPAVEKRSVKLVELGPRMKLRMTKVEEGLCSGKILWHEYLHKSSEEAAETERRWDKRRSEKEERRRVQKENVDRKRAEKTQPEQTTGAEESKNSNQANGSTARTVDSEEDDWDSDDLDGSDLIADDHEENEVVAG